eukprot:TRINITY_DN1306_c0_g1_i1.p1 TRINITY_DN1306_c0_g1~~TRINITY_DN1306_c0_g1_i1.p1  ORF type:complete len:399 (+),score=98.44 TRINITY_DN1306_c0_g1_i1:188-1384(+)
MHSPNGDGLTPFQLSMLNKSTEITRIMIEVSRSGDFGDYMGYPTLDSSESIEDMDDLSGSYEMQPNLQYYHTREYNNYQNTTPLVLDTDVDKPQIIVEKNQEDPVPQTVESNDVHVVENNSLDSDSCEYASCDSADNYLPDGYFDKLNEEQIQAVRDCIRELLRSELRSNIKATLENIQQMALYSNPTLPSGNMNFQNNSVPSPPPNNSIPPPPNNSIPPPPPNSLSRRKPADPVVKELTIDDLVTRLRPMIADTVPKKAYTQKVVDKWVKVFEDDITLLSTILDSFYFVFCEELVYSPKIIKRRIEFWWNNLFSEMCDSERSKWIKKRNMEIIRLSTKEDIMKNIGNTLQLIEKEKEKEADNLLQGNMMDELKQRLLERVEEESIDLDYSTDDSDGF